MPVPSRRLTSARRSSASSRSTAAIKKDGKQPSAPSERTAAQKTRTEEFVGLPDAGLAGLEAATPATPSAPAAGAPASARSASIRSSRRVVATGATTSNRTAVSGPRATRQLLTPEEREAKRKASRSMLLILGGVAVAMIVVVIAVLALTHRDPVIEAAQGKLAALRTAIPTLTTKAAYDEALATLAGIPDLPVLAASKAQLSKSLAAREAAVLHAAREVRVSDNRRAILAQLARLTDPAVDLARLAADAQAFVLNPVEPTAAPNPDYATEFASAVGDIQVRLASVNAELARRATAATTGAVQKIQLEVDALLKEEKFAAAETLVTEAAGTYPKADFAKVRKSIADSAASTWTSVEVYVDARFKDYASPGITATVRQQVLAEAKARLDGVISTWGIPTYISQAEALKAKY
jgi:hypothetical protein